MVAVVVEMVCIANESVSVWLTKWQELEEGKGRKSAD